MFYRIVFVLKDFSEAASEFFSLLFNTVFSVGRVIVLSKYITRLPSSEKNECIILGNGPSLKKALSDFESKLKTCTLFCVNSFPSTPEFLIFRPEYGVFLDPLFYNKNKLEDTPPHINTAISKLIENTNWEFTLFVPVMGKNSSYIKELPLKNENIRVVYFNYVIINGFSFLKNLLFKLNLGMPRCQNVLGASLFLSINMNFKKIYLLGADHNLGKNLFVNDENELCMIHEHFYSDGKPWITPVYKKPGGGERMNIAGFYTLCVKTFKTYYEINAYSEYKGAQIFNATEGSFIDAFKRIKL